MGNASRKVIPSKRLDGKIAVVTGANTGIGKITAKELYILGAKVILACRDKGRADIAVDEIKNDTKDNIHVGELCVKELNLSSFHSIRKCAEDINKSEDALHFLINNAGVMMTPKGKTEDGFETQFAVNHLGHFLFTCLLLPKLIKSAPSKIINVSSKAYESGRIVWDDINWEKRPYSARLAYCQSKLANVLFTNELARRLQGTNVTAFSLHPGVVLTELGRHLDTTYFPGARKVARIIFSPFFITPEEGAKTSLYALLSDNENESGSYYSDCQLKELTSIGKNEEDALRLWEESCKMVKLDFDPFNVG